MRTKGKKKEKYEKKKKKKRRKGFRVWAFRVKETKKKHTQKDTKNDPAPEKQKRKIGAKINLVAGGGGAGSELKVAFAGSEPCKIQQFCFKGRR